MAAISAPISIHSHTFLASSLYVLSHFPIQYAHPASAPFPAMLRQFLAPLPLRGIRMRSGIFSIAFAVRAFAVAASRKTETLVPCLNASPCASFARPTCSVEWRSMTCWKFPNTTSGFSRFFSATSCRRCAKFSAVKSVA